MLLAFKALKSEQRVLVLFLGVTALGLFTWAAYQYVPMWIDWPTYRRAALALAGGHNPYLLDKGFYSAPWLLIPLLPIALLPEKWGGAVMLTLSVVLLIGLSEYFKAGLAKTAALVLSLPVLFLLYSGQVDIICLAGITLNPIIGLFFVLAKPQIGIGLAVFWAWQAWRQGGLRKLVITFSPVTIAYIVTFAIFGTTILQGAQATKADWNYSIWPISIPIGLAILSLAIRQNRMEWALIASPMLSPYLGFYSWTGAILGTITLGPEFFLIAAGSWLPFFLTQASKSNCS